MREAAVMFLLKNFFGGGVGEYKPVFDEPRIRHLCSTFQLTN